jgi:hypothetical protein
MTSGLAGRSRPAAAAAWAAIVDGARKAWPQVRFDASVVRELRDG